MSNACPRVPGEAPGWCPRCLAAASEPCPYAEPISEKKASICPQCNTAPLRPGRQFCSTECSNASRTKVGTHGFCVVCNKPLVLKQKLCCSNACRGKQRTIAATPAHGCLNCDNPLSVRQTSYCCDPCARKHRAATAFDRYTVHEASFRRAWENGQSFAAIGATCGNMPFGTIGRYAKHLGLERKAAAISGPGSPTTEQVSVMAQMYQAGRQYEDIRDAVNRLPGSYRLSRHGQFISWARRLRVKRPPEYIHAACKAKGRKAWETRHKNNPATVKKKDGPSPIAIPLREVYRWGFTLGIPSAKRGDIEAVSRAMKLEEPDHPGFVLAQDKGWTHDPLRVMAA